jgi:hypothetical protein
MDQPLGYVTWCAWLHAGAVVLFHVHDDAASHA